MVKHASKFSPLQLVEPRERLPSDSRFRGSAKRSASVAAVWPSSSISIRLDSRNVREVGLRQIPPVAGGYDVLFNLAFVAAAAVAALVVPESGKSYAVAQRSHSDMP